MASASATILPQHKELVQTVTDLEGVEAVGKQSGSQMLIQQAPALTRAADILRFTAAKKTRLSCIRFSNPSTLDVNGRRLIVRHNPRSGVYPLAR